MEDWVRQLTRPLSRQLGKKHKDNLANLLNKLHTNNTTWCYQHMPCNTSQRIWRCRQAGTEHIAQQQYTNTDGEDNFTIHLSGQYELEVTPEVLEIIDTDDTTIDIVWLTGNSKKNNNRKFKLKRELVLCIYRKIKESRVEITKIVGHTRAIVTSPTTNKQSIFYAHPCYKGEQ